VLFEKPHGESGTTSGQRFFAGYGSIPVISQAFSQSAGDEISKDVQYLVHSGVNVVGSVPQG
jgi:hypothetical protein